MLLVEFAARTLGQAVAENDAVAVIGFVLQASGEEPGAGDGDVVAPRILTGAGG